MSTTAPLDMTVRKSSNSELLTIFDKYATVEKDGKRFMTYDNFLLDYLQMDKLKSNIARAYYGRLINSSRSGLISFQEFEAFESLLLLQDAPYRLLFQLFDADGNGGVTFDEFRALLSSSASVVKFPFNFNCLFLEQHFGKKKSRQLGYTDFIQFYQEFRKENFLQALMSKSNPEGVVPSKQLADAVRCLRGHRLSETTLQQLGSLQQEPGKQHVSLQRCLAFDDFLANLPIFLMAIQSQSGGRKSLPLSKEDVMQSMKKYPMVTPAQVDILFELCNLNKHSGEVSTIDVLELMDQSDPVSRVSSSVLSAVELASSRQQNQSMSFTTEILQSVYRFGLGSVAGAVGAAAVFPIDLVKTRLQNQRSVIAGEIVYKNSFDCFRKVVRNEGVFGLYRGLLPQLIGVAPEKAIKLTMNDFMRGKLTDKHGDIALLGEIAAGGMAGASQVMFTNPLEIVKIRMQVAGEMSAVRPSAWTIIKELGFAGLYKGSRACFLRDIPFSAIYFPTYIHLKKALADKQGYNNSGTLFLAAVGAGVPAAGLVTPADVIKTRLQVKARRGQQTYRGVTDAFIKIWQEEGGRAFWKGAPARIFRSSPQFGVTLLAYETLQRTFYVDFGGRPPKTELAPWNSGISTHPDHVGGFRLGLSTFSALETQFGLTFPVESPRGSLP